MSVSEKIKALLAIKGKKNIDLANYLHISNQSLSNKFSRGSFSADDLINISNFLGCSLEFKISENQSITLDKSDLHSPKEQ